MLLTECSLSKLMVSMHWVPIQDTWQAVHKVHKCMVCSLSGAHTWPSWKQHVNVWWLTRCGWSGMFMQAQSDLVCIKVHTQLCVYWPPWLQRLLVWQAWNEQAKVRNLYCYKLATYWHKCMPTLIVNLSLCWYRVRKPSGADARPVKSSMWISSARRPMSLIKTVWLHEFVAMYTNYLLTKARPLRSKHLSCRAGVLKVPLLDLLTYKSTSQRVPTLHQKVANLLLRLLHLRISAISELQYEVGDNQNSSDSAKLSFLWMCSCLRRICAE